MINKHISKCLMSLAIRKNANQNLRDTTLCPQEQLSLKKADDNKCRRGCEELESSYTAVGNIK